jgi:hypothetical protein
VNRSSFVVAVAVAVALALAAVGCDNGVDQQPLIAPTPGPARATPTALATEGSPVVEGSFYKPPGWDGVSDVNCKTFDTRAHAQSFFKGTHGSKSNDPYGLDGDHDGKACETLP